MGRGEYYKNKYGRGGRGRGGRGDHHQAAAAFPAGPSACPELRAELARIDGRPYGAYKDLGGRSFRLSSGATLTVDRVQSDPFAPPSHVHVDLPAALLPLPDACAAHLTATGDYLARRVAQHIEAVGAGGAAGGGGWHGAKGGDLRIDAPGQHVLERTCAQCSPQGDVQIRLTAALPARGRSIEGARAADLLLVRLPAALDAALLRLPRAELEAHVRSVVEQGELRAAVVAAGGVAFVADGAVLPRASGVDDRPMPGAVPFSSPDSLRRAFTLPSSGRDVAGMLVPRGVTVIVGGGFHGKTTLLKALEVGVYDHVPGDGREFVVTDPGAVKVRAEEGRSVDSVDIRPFISNLPFARDTASFSTADASGSTSQAAGIIEALEAGCSTLLLDEDTCATNAMIRDDLMQRLVAPAKEPITPFVAKVRPLLQQHGVSTVLVCGASGDFFSLADTVVMMDCYAPADVTERAHALSPPAPPAPPSPAAGFGELGARSVRVGQLRAAAEGEKVATRAIGTVQFGRVDLDLSGVEQLVETSQTRAIADALQWAGRLPGSPTVPELLDAFDALASLDAINPGRFFGAYARPRRFELAAALSRLRVPLFA